MAKVTWKIEGLSELLEAFEELPKATGKNVLKRVLMKAGQPIADDARANARVLKGRLQRSYGVSTKLSRRQATLHKKESAVEVFAGPGALVQAITEEFGTAHQAAHPTMRPAWDANKRTALDSIAQDLDDEIQKAAQRIARKQARLIAQTS